MGARVAVMQMQRRLIAGANRGTLGGASGRQTECWFVRRGGRSEQLFGARVALQTRGTRDRGHSVWGAAAASWGAEAGRGGCWRVRFAGWMKPFVGCDSITPAVPGLMFPGLHCRVIIHWARDAWGRRARGAIGGAHVWAVPCTVMLFTRDRSIQHLGHRCSVDRCRCWRLAL
ncbi:hypothetical protein V8C42DRAFT_197644 [Trichoderma barbatum]